MKERQGGLENLVSQELRHIVSAAMQKLRTRHKAVLVMRCYDGMSYAEIADSMGATEFSTRMLFVRAKRALQKELSRNGFGKGSLLAALVVFGKMTAPSEAAAAELTVPLAVTKAGMLASLASIATTKTAIVSITAAGALAVGTVAITPQLGGNEAAHHAVRPGGNVEMVSTLGAPTDATGRYRYYFPEGPQGPVMLRAELASSDGHSSRLLLQNDLANYDQRDGRVSINNYRVWSADLSVMRLPTDNRALSNFLTRIEGTPSRTEPVSATSRGLLVTVEQESGDTFDTSKVRPMTVRHQNVLQEDYFQSDWPVTAKIADNRDAMHARGWTYFRVRGQVSGHSIAGTGRIPFVYGTSERYSPWLKLRVADAVTLTDGSAGALVLDAEGATTARYAQGSFFQGLSRPWMGLHTIDLVRRDAAEQRIAFETQVTESGREVEITLSGDRITLVYTIDLAADLVRKIEFRQGRRSLGQLEFEYLQDLDGNLDEFEAPAGLNNRVSLRESQGIGWLIQLADGAFTR